MATSRQPHHQHARWISVARRFSYAATALLGCLSLLSVNIPVSYASALSPKTNPASVPPAVTPTSHGQSANTRAHASNIKEADAWRRLSHYGSRPLAPNAVRKAFQQASALPVTGGAWQPLGPQPMDTSQCNLLYCADYQQVSGRVTAIAVNPDPTKTGKDVWLGAADGGLWHTTDAGGQWTPALDVADSDYPALSIGAIAISPSNQNVILVGTGEANCPSDIICRTRAGNQVMGNGLFVSTDGGQTFTHMLGESGQLQYQYVSRIAVSYSTSFPWAVAATSYGIWFSADTTSYAAWTHENVFANDPNEEVTDVVFDPTHVNVAYAGVATTVEKDPTTGTLIKSPVIRSTDYGQTWTPVDLSLTNGTVINRTTLGISQDGTHIYALMSDDKGNQLNNSFYLSGDGGSTWGAAPDDQLNMQDDSGLHQWSYDSTIAVDPTNSANVYVGGVDLWLSSSSGTHFTNVTGSYLVGGNTYKVHTDHHALTFIPGQDALYDGNDGGVWRWSSACPSCTWSFTNLNGGGLNLTQFYGGSVGTAGSDASLWGGAQDNGESHYPVGAINCSVSCAAQWTETMGGDGGDTAVDYTNNANVFEEYIDGSLDYSTDGGSTWAVGTNGINICNQSLLAPCNISSPDRVNFVMPFVMSATHPQTLFAGTNRVYETTDGAQSWSPVTGILDPRSCDGNPAPSCPISALAVDPTDDNVVFAGTNDGVVCWTYDGWVSQSCTSPGPNNAMVTGLAIDPTDSNIVYATFNGYNNSSQGHVYKFDKTVGSGTWNDISGAGSSALPGAPAMSVLVNPNNQHQLFVGTDAGIYTTSDNGQSWSWSHFGTGLPDVEVNQLFTDHIGNNLYVATDGRGMWTIPLVSGAVYAEYDEQAPEYCYNGSICGYYATGITDVYADAAADGHRLWTDKFGDGSTVVTSSIKDLFANSTVYYLDVETDNTSAGSSSAYVLYALDANTGQMQWQATPPLASGSGAVLAYANGAVYIGADKLYAFSAASGALLWSSVTYTTKPGTAPPTASGVLASPDLIYVTAPFGALYAYDPSTGAKVWTAKSSGYGPVAFSGSTLYASRDPDRGSVGIPLYLDALDGSTGKLLWEQQYQVAGQTQEPQTLTVSGNAVYVGGYGNSSTPLTSVLAVNATTGALLWAYDEGRVGYPGTPTVANGVVYDGSQTSLVALNAATGTLFWPSALGEGVVSLTMGTDVLYTNVSSSGLTAINPVTGATRWTESAYLPGGFYIYAMIAGAS